MASIILLSMQYWASKLSGSMGKQKPLLFASLALFRKAIAAFKMSYGLPML